MLGVDLVGSRQIQPAHVGCAIGPDGSRRIQTVLSSLAAIQAWVQEENQQNLAMDRAYLAGQGAFPQRAAPNQLGGRFLTDFYAMVAHWADWATTNQRALVLQPEIVTWLVGERPSWPAGRAATGDDPVVSPPRDRPIAWSAGSSLRR
jgi:hypothetical protein